MADHSARDHATWSASVTDRNWNCPGALALTMDLPEDTNEAADWGTVCHMIAEKCLRDNRDADEFIGTVEKGKKHEFEVDEEMSDTAQMYVDYVRQRQAAYKEATGRNAIIFIEERFSFETLKPPFEAGGTGDCVLIFPLWKELEVVDLKGGRGVVVEAKGNPQARSYALGAILKHPSAGVEKVISTIVQPRAGHKDGRVRSETISLGELTEWTTDLLAAMQKAEAARAAAPGFMVYAQDEIDDETGRPFKSISSKVPAAWAAKYLRAGAHCKFCKAAGFCPALEQKVLDEAAVWFDDLDQPRIGNAPDTLSPERAAQLLDAADMIGDWINAVRAYWHAQAEVGVSIPNYVLVEKEGREKWLDAAAEAKAATLAAKAGVADDKVFNAPKIRTPKQVREAVRKAKGDLAAFEGLSAAPKTGTNLVRETKTTRPAATPSVDKFLVDLDEVKLNIFD